MMQAARAIDRNPGSFSRILHGKEGMSFAAAQLLARALGEDVNEMLGITAPAALPIRNLSGYEESLSAVRKVVGHQYNDDLWERVGAMILQPHPEYVTTMFLLRMAEIVKDLGVKSMTSGSDTSPPSRPGGHRRSGGKIRTR